MKVVQFTNLGNIDHSVHFQEDRHSHFYPHLHCHNEIQITWIISGEGILFLDNTMQYFKSGDMFVMGANQPHFFKSEPSCFDTNNSNKIHSLNIYFNPNGFLSNLINFPEMLGIKNFMESTIFGMQASGENAAKLGQTFLKVGNASAGFRLAYFIELLQVMANFKHWQYLSAQSFAANITDSEDVRMNQIFRYTTENFTENISLEQIASIACLTTQSFCRYFKKHTGKTYIHFLNEVRVNEACKTLAKNNFDSIGTVAYKCGFNSVMSFNRVFKTFTKKTPKDFIRSYHYNN
ncbi:MAG: AraC family transcriptional regulator [Ginsengibacter sp.]